MDGTTQGLTPDEEREAAAFALKRSRQAHDRLCREHFIANGVIVPGPAVDPATGASIDPEWVLARPFLPMDDEGRRAHARDVGRPGRFMPTEWNMRALEGGFRGEK